MEAVTTLELEITDVGAQGVCIARHEGQVVFVTGAIPGERVRAIVTGSGKGGRFLRAEVVKVLEPSSDRVTPACGYAGVCGGCTWQHVSRSRQLELKTKVLRDALTRIGGIDAQGVSVTEATGDGTRWRTRIRMTPNDEGRLGFRAARSHDVVVVDDCVISRVTVPTHVTEWPSEVLLGPDEFSAIGRTWRVHPAGFWQPHVLAAELLAQQVRARSGLRPGDRALDLYSGVGLFSAVLAEQVGMTGNVEAVESNPAAVRDAKHNLVDLPQVHVHRADVGDWLTNFSGQADAVVVDPPRSGVAQPVVDALLRIAPTTLVMIACDAASFARDLAKFLAAGWSVTDIEGYDLFPMTAHLEIAATLKSP